MKMIMSLSLWSFRVRGDRMDKETQAVVNELKDILNEIEGKKMGLIKFAQTKEVVGSVPRRSIELVYIKPK